MIEAYPYADKKGVAEVAWRLANVFFLCLPFLAVRFHRVVVLDVDWEKDHMDVLILSNISGNLVRKLHEDMKKGNLIAFVYRPWKNTLIVVPGQDGRLEKIIKVVEEYLEE